MAMNCAGGSINRRASGLWKSIWRVDCFRAKTRRAGAVGVRHDNVAIMYPFTSARAAAARRRQRRTTTDDGAVSRRRRPRRRDTTAGNARARTHTNDRARESTCRCRGYCVCRRGAPPSADPGPSPDGWGVAARSDPTGTAWACTRKRRRGKRHGARTAVPAVRWVSLPPVAVSRSRPPSPPPTRDRAAGTPPRARRQPLSADLRRRSVRIRTARRSLCERFTRVCVTCVIFFSLRTLRPSPNIIIIPPYTYL